MNAVPEEFLSKTARVNEASIQPFPNSRKVYVEGSLRTRNWEGQDGQKRSRVEVVANRVIFLDRTGSGVAPLGEEGGMPPAVPPADLESDDLPF